MFLQRFPEPNSLIKVKIELNSLPHQEKKIKVKSLFWESIILDSKLSTTLTTNEASLYLVCLDGLKATNCVLGSCLHS